MTHVLNARFRCQITRVSSCCKLTSSVVKMARKSISKRGNVEKLEHRVSHARLNLIMSFMVYMASPKKAVCQRDDFHQKVSEEIESTVQSSKSLRDDLNRLVNQFSDLKIDVEETYDTMNRMLGTQKDHLLDISNELGAVFQGQSSGLERLSAKLVGVTNTMDREIRARRRVLDSLRFPQMGNRRDLISRAFGETYQWIFRSHDDDGKIVWDNFIDWLTAEDSHCMYWVSGKPGSGKSTLMRELDGHIASQSELGGWLAGRKLIAVSYYFWYAGTANEKSFLSLLSTVVHSVLRERDELFDRVIPTERWERSLDRESQIHPWTMQELKQVVQRISEEIGEDARILLLVDGLDEYEGTDEEREEMVRFLERLTSTGDVKLCLSSRPWNIYKDLFSGSPRLRLELLTKDDIDYYVHKKLQGDQLFRRNQKMHPQLLNTIAEEIVQRADGVFLWVRLVVRDLLKSVRDGSQPKSLIQKLRDMPPDLDSYFKRMINEIEPAYRKDASTILQVALCNLDFEVPGPDNGRTLQPGPQLLLLQLDYLDEEGSPNFAAETSFLPIRYDDSDDIKDRINMLDRRLASRCMGLLETSLPADASSQWQTKLEFLHRTVKDFLRSPTAQEILHSYTDGAYNAHLFHCNAIPAHFISLGSMGYEWWPERLHLFRCFVAQIPSLSQEEEMAYLLYENMASTFAKWSPNSITGVGKSDTVLSILINAVGDREVSNGLSIVLAIQLGWLSYVNARLTGNLINQRYSRPLLFYALIPSVSIRMNPHAEIVERLLHLGADPNEPVTEMTTCTVWMSFMLGLSAIENIDRSSCLRALRALIEHGAQQWISSRELDIASRELELELSGVNRLFSSNIGELLQLFGQRLSKYEFLRKVDGCSEGIPSYRAIDVLRCISSWSNPHIPLFDYDAIEMLEKLQVRSDLQADVRVGAQESPTGNKRKQAREHSTVPPLSSSKKAKPSD